MKRSIVKLKAGDIDSAQNIIRIVQAKGRKDRHVMLPPEMLSLQRLHCLLQCR
jgi:integrase/recombinase XerD